MPALILFAIPQTEQNVHAVERFADASILLAAIIPAGLILTTSIKLSRRLAFAAGTWCLLGVQLIAYFVLALRHFH